MSSFYIADPAQEQEFGADEFYRRLQWHQNIHDAWDEEMALCTHKPRCESIFNCKMKRCVTNWMEEYQRHSTRQWMRRAARGRPFRYIIWHMRERCWINKIIAIRWLRAHKKK